ncbi:peptidoglycan DD-metalloendopeptidase family protein [Paenibacillus sp. FA6]|uniref:peptidoglycan DD-metalloendopeptidase family protein n=1 Tax=Paenibacillus sp. FA6 TaxID=3413029 RepID=UPI003F65B6AA
MKEKLNHLVLSGMYRMTILAVVALVTLMTACGGGIDTNINTPSSEDITITDNHLKPDELPQAMLDARYSQIYERFSPAFKGQISEANFAEMAEDFTQGVESFEQASAMQLNGSDQRVWLNTPHDKGIFVVFDETGFIVGLQIMNLSTWTGTDEMLTTTTYELPFHGDWLVFWGGSNMLVNYHYEYESQRYAYDFVQVKNGYSFTGDPLKNNSYYAFGQDILAPADGTVISVVNHIPDNEPVGVMNEKEPAGNVVVIDHGGEYSFLAHLKKDSVTVNPGDQVKLGDKIGELGNSGNSSEAHLHFQISDGEDLFDSSSLNVRWKDGLNPIRGETLQSTAY